MPCTQAPFYIHVAGVKNLLAGEQQAAVTVAVEALMDNKPEAENFAVLDPKVRPEPASCMRLLAGWLRGHDSPWQTFIFSNGYHTLLYPRQNQSPTVLRPSLLSAPPQHRLKEETGAK